MEEEIVVEGIEERSLHNTRSRVDQLLTEGWDIVSRAPLILKRGSAKVEVRKNGIIISA